MQVDVPASALALQSLVESSSGSLDGFEFGWSLASLNKSSQTISEPLQTQVCWA